MKHYTLMKLCTVVFIILGSGHVQEGDLLRFLGILLAKFSRIKTTFFELVPLAKLCFLAYTDSTTLKKRSSSH